MALANGSSDGTVKYWDLETFKNITITNHDVSSVNHLLFNEQNAEHLFAASSSNLRVMNIENNTQLDCIAVPLK